MTMMKRIRRAAKIRKRGNWTDEQCWYVVASYVDKKAAVLGPFKTDEAARQSCAAARALAAKAFPADIKLPMYVFVTEPRDSGHLDGVLNDQAGEVWTGEAIILQPTSEG